MSDEYEEDLDEEGDEELCEVVSGAAGCERCQALDGHLFLGDPTPFHPLCQCEVRLIKRNPPTSDCVNDWMLDHVSSHHDPSGVLMTVWRLYIKCPNGNTYETDAAVNHGTNIIDFEDVVFDAYDKLYDDAEALAAQYCGPCPLYVWTNV